MGLIQFQKLGLKDIIAVIGDSDNKNSINLYKKTWVSKIWNFT